MKTTKEKIEVMQASEQGAKIESIDSGGCVLQCEEPIWNWHYFDYRIVPEPEYAPLEAKDIPPVCWIRPKSDSDRCFKKLVSSIGCDKISAICGDMIESLTFRELFSCYEMSADLKNWTPCRKLKE